jgi:hypothetical protein
MDDGQRLLFLLLAGVLPLVALRERLDGTSRGRKLFAALVALYVLAGAVALIALFTVGPARPPIPPDAPLIQT